MLHDVPSPTEGSNGQSPTDDLAEAPQVRRHAEPFGGTAASQTEPGDDLVKDEEGARRVARGTQPLEETLSRGNQPHVGGHRLYDHCCDGVVQGGNHVVWGDDGVGNRALGHPVAARQALIGHTAAASGQQGIGVAVVATGELDDARSACGATSQTDGRHGGLGSR